MHLALFFSLCKWLFLRKGSGHHLHQLSPRQEEVTVLRAGGGWPRHEKECPVCRKEPTVQGQKLRAKELTSPSYACFARMQAQTDRPLPQVPQVLAAVPGTRMEKVGALLLNILAKMRLSGHLVAEAPQ